MTLSAPLAGNRTARKLQNFSQKVKKFSTFRISRLFAQKSPGMYWNVNFSTFRLFEFFNFFDFFDFSTFRIFRIFRLFEQKSPGMWTFRLFDFSGVTFLYHGWSFQRKVAFEPPKQYTKLDAQGFLSYHLSSTRRQARSRFCGSRKCLARNPPKIVVHRFAQMHW